MSSDLWSAFGASEHQPQHQTQRQDNRTPVAVEEDDDDFGDFEGPENGMAVGASAAGSSDLLNLSDDKAPGPSEVSTFSDNTFFDADTQDYVESRDPAVPRAAKEVPASEFGEPAKDSNNEWGDFVDQSVLFDAEQVENQQKQQRLKREKQENEKAYDFDANDSWEPVSVAQTPLVPSQVIKTRYEPTPSQNPEAEMPAPNISRDIGPPPTNIPPPSVLLSFITTTFQTLSTELKSLVPSTGPFSPLNVDQFEKTLSLIRASARVIAGRKLRWQRDTILSQSMKIGPAGRNTGMKLYSVDKGETRREDQEISEALHTWRSQMGSLRTTTAKANAAARTQGLGLDFILPDLNETMPVRMGKESEGAIKAPKCCFLCGVRRDERVARIDLFVEDSFGEWWTEHWGHMDCVSFWEECKERLPQR